MIIIFQSLMKLYFQETILPSALRNPGINILLVSLVSIIGGSGAIKAQSNIDLALDTSELEWVSNGLWFFQTEVSDDAVDALASAPLDNDEASTLGLTIEGPATGSFWWKVSSEKESDFLYLVIDGEVVARFRVR